jgi:hypothetical protein
LAEPELEKMPLLVLCNKQDLGAISLEKMSAELNLNSVIGSSRSWRLCGCSVDLGDGVCEALDWLGTEVNKRK